MNGTRKETLETQAVEFRTTARTTMSPDRCAPAPSPIAVVFLECRQHLRSFIARFLPRAHDIDDIVQEVFLRASDAERTRNVRAPKAYLFSIARNLSLKEITHRARHGQGDPAGNDIQEISSNEASLEDQVEGDRKLVAFCRAVASLPPQCRRAFLMRKIHDRPYKEIADELGVTVRTVEKHVATGLGRCGAYLQRLGYEPEAPIRAEFGKSPRKTSRTR